MSGTRRSDSAFMAAVPGLLMKGGADGVCAFALADGRAGAVKIDDGGQRALAPLLARLLLELTSGGGPDGVNVSSLRQLATSPVTGGGQPVGEIRAVLPSTG
jgi:L-asparaginase II